MLSGCWSYHDVEERTIVAGAAVDLLPSGDVLLTAETISFANEETSGKSELITSRGENFASALQQMSEKSGKELYWHHATVVILSEAYARQGVEELFDYIMNDMEARLTLRIAVARTENARDIYELETYGSQIKSEALNSMIEESEHLGSTPSRMAYENINAFLEEDGEMLMPLVYENGEGAESCAVAEGSALFKNGKLALWLDRDSTAVLLLLKNEVRHMQLDVPVKDGLVTVSAYKCRCKTKGEAVITAKYKIAETLGKIDLNTQEGYTELENAIALYLNSRISSLAETLNKCGFDAPVNGEITVSFKNRNIFDSFASEKER